jgi:hypothetical protein
MRSYSGILARRSSPQEGIPMNENDVLNILRQFISRQFPKDCSCCGKRFNSLEEYLQNTTHCGKPVSFDAAEKNWRPIKPIGTISMANCSCGTTLSISSKGLDLITFWRMMNWARKEARKRNITISDLLAELRTKLDKIVLHKK